MPEDSEEMSTESDGKVVLSPQHKPSRIDGLHVEDVWEQLEELEKIVSEAEVRNCNVNSEINGVEINGAALRRRNLACF